MNQFFNKYNDTISIKTNGVLNDEWIACHLDGSKTVIGTLIHHDTLSFLGITDSVKTIGFQVYDSDMNFIPCEITNMNLQISKNHGFIKTLNFYEFSDNDYDEFSSGQLEEYSLIGISDPEVGVQNLTWFDVNDFQIGDELHILDKYSSFDHWSENGTSYSRVNKAIYKYLERFNYTDSIVYRYSREQSISITGTNGDSYQYYNDTLKSVIRPDTDFDKLPGEPVFTDYSAYSNFMFNWFFPLKTDPSEVESIFPYSGDSWWGKEILDGCFEIRNYIKGLGGPYYECTNTMTMGGAERTLVYFKKGEITGGVPLLITTIPENISENQLLVFPNPASDFIMINNRDKLYESLVFDVFTIYGQLVKSVTITSVDGRIKTDDLSSGVYIYRICRMNGHILKTAKLIIK